MPRSDPPIDASSAIAFIAFALAASIWIGAMAVQPPSGVQTAAVVMTKDIMIKNVAATPPPPRLTEIADLAH